MSVLINDTGFHTDDFNGTFITLSERTDETRALHIPSDTQPNGLTDFAGIDAIRIDFPSFADGRGFTLARLLRLSGYTGRLRAHGHVISDQYAMARRAGFDEVEISDDLAKRQPEADWKFRATWKDHDYQSRMRNIA